MFIENIVLLTFKSTVKFTNGECIYKVLLQCSPLAVARPMGPVTPASCAAARNKPQQFGITSTKAHLVWLPQGA